MLSKNNGSPEACVNNLIRLVQGEVPYDRVKGVSVEAIDTPTSSALDDISEDVEWLLNTYEPRAKVESVEVTPDDTSGGHFKIKATINTNKEDDQ